MQGIGAATAFLVTGEHSVGRLLLGFLFGWLLHLSTHYSNEYYDLETDRANSTFTSWTGGSRVLVNGQISPQESLRLAIILSVLFIGGALVLDWLTPAVLGPSPRLILLSAISALALSWFYSAPPIRLTARGLGETTVATVLCLMLPSGAAILQIGYVPLVLLYIAVPLFPIQFARMMIMNVPDAQSDAQTGKRTLVVRLGSNKTAVVHNLLQIAAYASLGLLWLTGRYPTMPAILLAATLPIAVVQIKRMSQGDATHPDRFQKLASTALLHVVSTAVAVLVGLLIQAHI